MANKEKKLHTVYYKNIPIAQFHDSSEISVLSMTSILDRCYIECLEDEELYKELEIITSNLASFLTGNLPEGQRRNILLEKSESLSLSSLISFLDEFSGDVTIDKNDTRKFKPVPEHIGSCDSIINLIEAKEFTLPGSHRSSLDGPSSLAGNFDKFTAVLEFRDGEHILRLPNKDEVGNVIVKPAANEYKKIAVNEALFTTLAELCGINVPRHWIVSAETDFGTERHYVSERFGIHEDNGFVKRELVMDASMLMCLPLTPYAMSSEKFFKKMSILLTPQDMKKLLEYYIFGYIIGNSDMHLKNFSVIYHKDGFVLAPMYDIVSYKAYNFRHDMALTIKNNDCVSERSFVGFICTLSNTAHEDIQNLTDRILKELPEAVIKTINISSREEQTLVLKTSKFINQRIETITEILNIEAQIDIDNICAERGL